MAQASSRLFDNVGRIMNDAAGMADGVRREVESMARAQAERFIMDMDLVKREDYDALRELVQNQSAELKALKADVAALGQEVADDQLLGVGEGLVALLAGVGRARAGAGPDGAAPHADRLVVAPALPAEWEGFSAVLRPGKAVYRIRVVRGGEITVEINGEKSAGNSFDVADKGVFDVLVTVAGENVSAVRKRKGQRAKAAE